MTNPFAPATKAQSKLRLSLMGPSGSGKTYTALSLAATFVADLTVYGHENLGHSRTNGHVAVIDTERGSASKYADLFTFDVLELSDYHPQHYINALRSAEQNGYDVVVIDSLSHAWNATGGVLDMVDKAAKRSQSNNSFAAWRDVTPLHHALVDAILNCSCHVIVTMRSKTEYVLEKDERTGKNVPRKVGLGPVQRDGIEYEFDIAGELDVDNNLVVTKTRCSQLQGVVVNRPGAELAQTIQAWLSAGIEKHWALNGGGQRISALMKTLNLKWDEVKSSIESGVALEKLSDTTLLEWQVEARLREIAEASQ